MSGCYKGITEDDLTGALRRNEMSIPKYAAARDENEPEIIEALEYTGWTVCQVNQTGFPDLVCGRPGKVMLVEVLGEAKVKKYRKTGGLTPEQMEFHRSWPDRIHLISTIEQAIDLGVRERDGAG